MKIEMISRLYSKRNKVYKVRIQQDYGSTLAVLKEYSPNNKELLEKEYSNMQILLSHGIRIPRIIHKDENCLILEYIHGNLINDLVENLDKGNWIDELALWMAEFHRISNGSGSLLKGDVNLRNFIYSDGHIYGLDFEQINWGDPRIDLGNICFFILTNKPSFTKEKHAIMRKFLNSYEKHTQTKLNKMGIYLRRSKEEAKKRRSIRKSS